MPAPIRLVVFFSRGMSLAGWQRAGMFERELALYRRLQPHCERITFFTYGDEREHELAKALPGLIVLPNRWRLPANLYSVVGPWLHRRALADATVFKTNQLNGGWAAVVAKRYSRAKLIARGGFLWSDFVERLHPNSWRGAIAWKLERWVYQSADVAVATAEADGARIARRYHLDDSRVRVIPNFVDTAVFRPMPEITREPGRLLFVGRLDAQKNVMALLEALETLPDVTLDLVGDGPLAADLRALAERLRLRVNFLGTLPHVDLPALFARASIFVLPSHYEGHPKALLEAMACGIPVVGTDAPGIREIITHKVNGVLCGTLAQEIHSELAALLGDAPLCAAISAGGVDYVRRTCSLDAAAAAELELLHSL